MMNANATALLVVDMQNDVMKKLGAAGESVVPAVKMAIDACRGKGIPVIYILRVHRPDGIDVERFRLDIFNKSQFLVRDSDGAKVISELAPLPTDYLVCKQRFSGFFQTDLLMILMRLGVKSVAICGVQTPNCIRSTAVDAAAYDFDVSVLKDATAAQTSAIHEANLLDLSNMGIQTDTVHDFILNRCL